MTSFVKPNAKSEDILKCCQMYDITSNDRVVLCVGEHDSNPTKVFIELCATLKSLYMCPVLVLKVCNNIHLNVNRLNNMIKMICNQNSNCKFVDFQLDSNRRSKYYYTLNEFCKKINYTLDTIDYNLKFLPFNKDTVKIIRTGQKVKYECINQSTQTHSDSTDPPVQFFHATKCRWNAF